MFKCQNIEELTREELINEIYDHMTLEEIFHISHSEECARYIVKLNKLSDNFNKDLKALEERVEELEEKLDKALNSDIGLISLD